MTDKERIRALELIVKELVKKIAGIERDLIDLRAVRFREIRYAR